MMDQPIDVVQYNRAAWDAQVDAKNRWTRPVSSDLIQRARQGEFEVVLTPTRTVPKDWFPGLQACRTLCLACGGGQQAPLLSAAGAKVTVFDNSPAQLRQDHLVAERDGLSLEYVQGDMRDLSQFADHSFDLVFHPCSISFVPEVDSIWREVHRVLEPGGTYLLGACNPVFYIFDYQRYQQGELSIKYSLPYSDLEDLSAEELEAMRSSNEPFCFGHTLESILGGVTQSGLAITGFFEDYWGADRDNLIDRVMPSMFAIRCVKGAGSRQC